MPVTASSPFVRKPAATADVTWHDEDGLISYELVTYPYPDEYVNEAVFGAGT